MGPVKRLITSTVIIKEGSSLLFRHTHSHKQAHECEPQIELSRSDPHWSSVVRSASV